MTVRFRWVALLLTFVTISTAGCGAKAVRRNPRVPVTVAKVERRPVPVELAASGTIEPIQSADVGSQVGGVVTRIRIREGDYVRAGQVLIELDSRPFHAALAQSRGVLERDRAQAEAARLDWERAQKMLEQNLIAQADYDQKRAAAQSANGTLAADSAAYVKARLDMEYASIRAPITGRSGKLNVHVGDLVKENTSDPLVTVNQISPIRVRFSVPQSDIPSIQRYRNQSPRVYVRPAADDSAETAGNLTFVDNQVDPSSGTLLLKGELANGDSRFWPGEFVEVRLVLAIEANAVVVPAVAVTRGQQGTYVYVLNADSTASARPVTVQRSDDLIAVVTGGLDPGETVVTDGQFRLASGSKVLVREPHSGQ